MPVTVLSSALCKVVNYSYHGFRLNCCMHTHMHECTSTNVITNLHTFTHVCMCFVRIYRHMCNM